MLRNYCKSDVNTRPRKSLVLLENKDAFNFKYNLMRKFIYLVGALMIGLVFNSCKCTQETNYVTPEIVVENTISADRQTMYLDNGENYRWYETGVVLKDWLDEENDGAIEMVVNVFQVVEQFDSTSFDTIVYKYQHTVEGTTSDSVHGFWVEDYPLNEEIIKVTFKEAYDKVMSVNLPKPHSRQVVLRKEIGPKDCNPQWIFGNSRAQIYVDAVTGEVSKDNPAFGPEFEMPLGEWP